MEAIDDYANENIARSLSYTVLEYRQQHDYAAILPLASRLLLQRIRFLGSPSDTSNAAEWDQIIQWQTDSCPEIIETLWSDQQDHLYQNPVYYKRFDAETLHCMVEFATRKDVHYAVVLVLEGYDSDCSELKYHNTKAFTDKAWQSEVVDVWSESLEEAERVFVKTLSRDSLADSPKSVSRAPCEAPDDYWGEWSSDEERETCSLKAAKCKAAEKDDDESDEEYYARWSQNPPGVLTPGLNEHEPAETGDNTTESRLLKEYNEFKDLDPMVKEIEQQEIQEEYDNSYNPLYTVPSVPDLMGMHHSALAELTQMLQTSLPPSKTTAPLNTQNIPTTTAPSQSQPNDSQTPSSSAYDVPGAYPESDRQIDPHTNGQTQTQQATSSWENEAGKMLLVKSLRALVGVGKLLGFQGHEILDMTREVVNSS